MNELETKILAEINKFRNDPKKFLGKTGNILPKNLNNYTAFLNRLEKRPDLKQDQELSKIAKEEAKKFFEDIYYNQYQIGDEFKLKLNKNFSKKESALMAIDNLNDINDLIPNVIMNDSDKEKRGRTILANPYYTHIGIGYYSYEENEETEEISYVLIFSKKNNKQYEINIENKIHEESINVISKEETVIYEQIKKFRESPLKFNLQKYQKFVKKKFRKEYESFLLNLEKMPQIIFDKDLSNISKEEVKKLSEDSEYNKIQIGEELNLKFNDNINNFNYDAKNSALIALENINNIEELIPKIIINDSDKNQKGRKILTNKEFTHVGISQLEITNIIYIVFIFSKIDKKNQNKNNKNSEINKEKYEIINKKCNENKEKIKENFLITPDINIIKEKIKNNSIIKNQEINNIIENIEIFFFTSIQFHSQLGNLLIQINKIEKQNNEKYDYFEYKKVFDDTHYYDYFIYYFKLIIPKRSLFQLILYYDNNNFYFSDIIKVENINLLGYLGLNSRKLIVNQLIYKDIKLLLENEKLLNLFGADKNYLIPFLMQYKLSKNSIKYGELLKTINIFSEYNCKPTFLKKLKWNDIDFNINMSNGNNNNISLPNDIKKIIEILNINEIEEENNKENENIRDIILKLYGYSYYKYFKNEFKSLVNNDYLFIESIKRLIKAKILNLNDLIQKDLIEKEKIFEFFSLVIENVTSISDIKKICKGLNLVDSLKLIVSHYELIKKKIIELKEGRNILVRAVEQLFNTNIELDIDVENTKEEDNIKEIFKLVNQYFEKVKKDELKIIIINIDNLIIKIKEINENNYNLENLIKLKDESKHLQENDEIKFDILFEIYKSIHDLGIYFSLNKIYNNAQIIKFISKDIFYISDEYKEHSKRDPKIFKNFDIYDLNKSGFEDFVQLKLYSKFEKNANEFYKIFIKKIKTLDDLNILFELFPKDQLNSEFLEILLKKIGEIANRTYYIINEEKLFENMFVIISNIIRNKNNIRKFIDAIEKTNFFKYNNRIKNIYIYIISKNNEEINNNSNAIDEIINYFINILDEINAQEIFNIIKSCILNKKFLIKIFNNKNITENFIYKEDDIYSPEISPNLDLYRLLIENKFIDDVNFMDTRYSKKISQLKNKIFFDLKDLNITFLKISNLIENHEKKFLSKLRLIFINEQNNIDVIFKKICENFKKCKNKFSELERINNYLIIFAPREGERIIRDIIKIINLLRTKKIKEILEEKETEAIDGFDILIEKSKNIRFKTSIIFMLIYEELKKEKINYKELELFNESLEKYKIIIKKIINYKNENFLKIEKIIQILNLLKIKEEEIQSEMNFISEEFKNDLNEINETIDNIKHNIINFVNLKEIKEYINGIYWLLKTFKSLHKNQNIQETEFTTNLTKISENLSSDNVKSEDVENANKILSNYNINIKEKNDFNILILKIYGKEEELKFCVGKKDEDIKNLNEYLIDRQCESESENLQPEDFDDFIGCKKYVNEIIESNLLNDKELFNELKIKFNKDNNFILKFNNYFEKYGEIKELYDFSLSDKSEITKSIIKKLLMKSKILIKKEGNIFNFKCECGNKEFDLDKLLELKNKSLFVQNTIKDDEEYKQQITGFKYIVENIKKLTNNIKRLISSGYPSNILIQLKIENNEMKTINETEQKAKYIFNKYQKLFKEFKKELINSYNNKPLLRFFYGPLFLEVIEKINKQKDIIFLLKAISNGKINKLPENGKYIISENLNFSEIFNIINNYISECLTLNELNLEKIFVKNEIISDIRGLYKLPIIQNIEKNILILYKQFTNNFPLSNTVLFCNEYTSIEEIRAFLFLSFKCEYKILFCLLGLENLDIQKRRKIIKEINKFNNKYGNEMQSCLTIIYSNNSEIKEAFDEIKPEIKNVILDYDNKGIKYENNNIEIYTSESTGYGKSEEIKKRIEEENKKYIYFPIGGDFSLKNIIERLIELNITQNDIKNYVLHLDFTETNLVKLLKDILLKILILKKLDLNEHIFYFGEINIKIELPNGFYNYMDKFPIFSLFINTNLKTLTPFGFQKDNIRESPIFIVADTLKKYKDNIIGKENINLVSDQELSAGQCEQIIDEYINNKENKYNYHQKTAYIKLLSEQFKKFKDSFVLDPSSFNKDDPNDLNNLNSLDKSRNQIIKSILESSIFFTKGPYDNLIKSQLISQKTSSNYDEEENNKQALDSLEKTKDNVTFDNIPGTLFFFNDDKISFTIICKQEKGTEEYNKYLNLIDVQSQYYDHNNALKRISNNELEEYKNRDHRFYLSELKKILNLDEMLFSEDEIKELNQKIREETKEELTSDIFNEKDINEDRKLYMEKLCKLNGNYIYTRDNFIKSVIILMKIKASLVVILMGETGCGKTSLLKMLSIFVNKGSDKMKIMNIHAGITDEDIIKFMNEKVLNNLEKELKEELNKEMTKFDKNLIENNNEKYSREKKLKELEEKLKKKKVWVFFDELNTCNSMGLLTEIMYKRTMLGKPLPDNLVFLGAANPYLKMTKQMIYSGLTYYTDKISKSNLLVYTVNPMPHTLINFIFNFSSLNKDEEREYIKSMVQQNIYRYYPNHNDENCQKLIKLKLDIICECHKFMREKYGIASVSLREIRRFNIFFKFFVDYLKNKSIYKDNYKNQYVLLSSAININIYLCYYLRISEKEYRQELSNKLSEFFEEKEFLKIPNKEVTYISEQFIIDTDKGIALNRSLKENLFTAFSCIVNRIPLIIVGKPGEGKSLTLQIINNTMKGIYSKSDLFKDYPQLFMYKYQGSETSTSQGIIETFKKTRAYAEKQIFRVKQEALNNKEGKYKEKFIAMVFFDELGLAERSPNNPLKAIHSQLEYDDNKFKIAFVGISNWKIDASKMNRCLTLSKPEPDKEDILNTSDTIAKAIDTTLANKYKSLINALATSYYNYKEAMNKKDDEKIKNFHGNRDFYHSIKCSMWGLLKEKNKLDDINENQDKILINIAVKSLARNFGGLNDSINNIISEFKNVYKKYEDNYYKYNILECIKDNLNDYNSRFLMLVANSTIMKYLESVLNSQNKKYIFMTGSKFQFDKKAAEKGGGYSEDLLNKIQFLMSRGNVVILKNLEVIYPSLYELFNQNFIKIGDKYFSKIAFANSNTSSEVNKKFRVILLITQEKLNKMKIDPPLLNRFEKQIISFKDSLNNEQIEFAEEIVKSLEQIKTFNYNQKKLVYNLPDLLINCTQDEIEGLIYKICQQYQDKINDKDFILNEILKIIVPTFCQDIIASVKYSGFNKGRNQILANKIIDIYKKREINNFEQFLQKIKKNKNVIYTFSHIIENIFPENSNFKYNEIDVDVILSENQVEEKISKSYEEKKDFLIFRFLEKNCDKMDNISYLINNYEAKYIKNEENNDNENINNLKIIFLVHLKRKLNKKTEEKNVISTEELISNLDDSYDIIFIDNLKNERNDFIDILDIHDSEKLIYSIIKDFDTFFDKILNKIITYLDYIFINKYSKIHLKEYTDIILKKLILNKEDAIVKYLRKHLIEFILKKVNKIDFIPKVFTGKIFQNEDIDFFQVLETYISIELSNKLLSIVYFLEKNGVFSCLLVNEKNEEIFKKKIILKQIEELFEIDFSTLIKKPISQLRANKIQIYIDISIPCCCSWFKNIIINFLENQKINQEYNKNENLLRPRKKIENEEKIINNYLLKYKDLVKGTKVEFMKNDNIREIFYQNDKNLKKLLFNDYLNIYCFALSNKFSFNIENIENPIKFLNLLLQLKFNILCESNNYENIHIEFKETFIETQNEFELLKFAEIFLYLESYKDDMAFLFEIYCFFNSKIPNIFQTIKDIIESKEIITEISDRNPYYKKRVNEIFFIILESLLKSIYKNKENICNFDDYNFYSFFDSLTSVEATLNKINQKFLLYSNELYSLRNILCIFKILKSDDNIKNIMKNILAIIEIDNEELQNKNFNKLKNNISQIEQIISSKFGENSDEVADYMSYILKEHFRKIDDEDYKFDLLKFAFETDKLIQRSLYFIEQMIKLPFPVLKEKNKGKKKNKYTFDTEEQCEKYFLNFISDKKEDKILSFFEKIKNDNFDHVLLYYFELIANNYFNEIKNKYKKNTNENLNLNNKSKEECEELILERNLSFLIKALDFLDKTVEKNHLEENNLNNLGKIYSIAYIKLYMKYLAEIFINNEDKIDFAPIIEIFSCTNNNMRKVVNIFFFKNCFIHFENYSKFKDYILKNEKFGKIFSNILEKEKNEKKDNYILNYNFTPNTDFTDYLKSSAQFMNIKSNNLDKLNTFITSEFLNNNGYDLLFCLLVNHLISFLYSAEKDKYINDLNNFKSEFNKIVDDLRIPQITINLFNALLNINESIKNKLKKDFTQEQFEIIMNSFRYVLLTSQANNNNFYYKLLTPQINEYISNNYIIGTLPYNNVVINSYYILEDLLKDKTQTTKIGYYVCTCGQYYELIDCTWPGYVSNCKNCNRQIGGTGHKLLGPEVGQTDHFRIIIDEEYKNKSIQEGVPYLFLDEYKKRYVDKYLNEQPKGIKNEKDEFIFELIFFKRYDKVRTLDELPFRILNYILYSHLLFSNLLGYLSEENLNSYIPPNFSCIKMINKNWEIIQTILNEKGINDIKIIMNIIFIKLSNLIKNIGDMVTLEKRQEFEILINNCINELINNIEEYEKEEKKYKEFNEKIKGSDAQSLVEIISENYSPFENIYNEEDFPNLGLFLLSNYPDLSELELSLGKIKDSSQKYCLLNQILICSDELKLIENVININTLVNLLYTKYNNKINREEAKNKKLLDCFDENEIKELKEKIIIPYIKSWNEIKSKCTNYLCRPDMPILNITTHHTLNYFLPDDGELGGGMYLASAYSYFIQLQNGFINNIINSIGDNSLLKSYLSQLNQEIKIQEAKESDLLKINESTLKKINDLIMKYSMRDIFKKDKIDFIGFKLPIKYNFDAIEKELARQILPGVKKFISSDKEEPIKFITFLYEAFRGNRSSILTEFNTKYPSRELNIEEKKLLYRFLNSKQKNSQNFIVEILSSCQILIDHIQKENYEQNKSISSVIKELPEYIIIDENFSYFFTDIGDKNLKIENNDNNDIKMFSINTLINIYDLIEYICWEQFKNNLNEQYLLKLDEEKKIKIKICIDNSINENSVIKKQDIANAVRRLISRYLSGKRGDTDISEYQKLFEQISRRDLWKIEIVKNDNFIKELTDLFENKIKKEINQINRCNERNKCEWCELKKNEEGFEDICFECNKCKGELLIGHSLDFFELINEDVFNPEIFKDKNNNNEIDENLELSKNRERNNENIIRLNKDSIINTSNENEENQNNEIIRENEITRERNDIYEDGEEDDENDEEI